MRQMKFNQALQVLIDTVPGLSHDLNLLAERRKTQAKMMDGIGQWGLSIPDPVEPVLRMFYPELYQDDYEQQAMAWKAFMRNPDSMPFRIQRKI